MLIKFTILINIHFIFLINIYIINIYNNFEKYVKNIYFPKKNKKFQSVFIFTSKRYLYHIIDI